MLCKVEGCRYDSTHLTQNHICGKCNRTGHGQRECGNFAKNVGLLKIIENDTPHKLHMIPVGTKYLNKSVYTPLVILISANGFRSSLNHGEYTVSGMGMGCCAYARHNGKYIEYLFLSDTEPQMIKDSTKLQQFINGYIKSKPKHLSYKPIPFAGLLD